MNNLKRFNTEADYSAATLSYPAVSWVTATDNVHFDKSAPAPVNDKVYIVGNVHSDYFYFYNEYAEELSFSALTFDGTEVNPITFRSQYLDGEATHTAIYSLTGTSIGSEFSAALGGGQASIPFSVEMLIPAQVTLIQYFPSNVANLIVEAEDPSTIEFSVSAPSDLNVFVPDASVDAYKASSGWSDMARYIYPISEYQGNLPV